MGCVHGKCCTTLEFSPTQWLSWTPDLVEEGDSSVYGTKPLGKNI
jgi:hypothetical protein